MIVANYAAACPSKTINTKCRSNYAAKEDYLHRRNVRNLLYENIGEKNREGRQEHGLHARSQKFWSVTQSLKISSLDALPQPQSLLQSRLDENERRLDFKR